MSELQVFNFDGRAVPTYQFRGRECWIAQDVARVLGYEPKSWSSSWRSWVDRGELLTEHEFDVLRGASLAEFKKLSDVTAIDAVSRAPNLTILFESGLNAVCLLTDKPLGTKLRRFVAEKVLPDLRRRSADIEALRAEHIALTLQLGPGDNATVWERDTLVAGLCRLYRKPWDLKGVWPTWLKQPLGRIYRIVLGEVVYKELKRRNPEPVKGSLHYQFLTEARHQMMTGRDMARVGAVLNLSNSPRQFFERLESEYGRAPRQLEMAG
jgi:prophage antirepressor-like protein